jgi:hypothetical protein
MTSGSYTYSKSHVFGTASGDLGYVDTLMVPSFDMANWLHLHLLSSRIVKCLPVHPFCHTLKISNLLLHDH